MNELTILLYHGVTKCRSIGIENASKKHISLNDYHEQMLFLKKHANILSMDDVINHYKENLSFPERAVAITFDDGFENNYTNCLPIIDEMNISTTFYISSGMIDSDEMFWVDKIEDCINLTSQKEIQVESNGKSLLLDLKSNESKIISLMKIKKICKLANNESKDDLIEQVISQTKVNPSIDHAENYKVLNWNQLKEMHGNEAVIIGGHSLKHEILSSLSDNHMKENIKESLRLLNSNLMTITNHYSYPEGQDEHYNIDVINTLIDQGIECSPSARYGSNNHDVDLFNLYRVMVGFDMINFPYEAILNNKSIF
jgi:peptidoglycan/xylan/chitin deacetylase (PgdA/CDA1 family)